MKQVVEAKSMRTGYESIYGDVCLKRTAGADANNLQGFEHGTDGTGFEVDVGERIEFIEHDVDVVRTNTGAAYGEALVADIAGMGNEFAVLVLEFDAVEILTDFFYAIGVSNHDDGICDFLRTAIEVVDSAAFVQYKFGCRYHGEGDRDRNIWV